MASRRVFISHSTYDSAAATELKGVLNRLSNAEVFLDREDLRPGEHLLDGLRQALDRADFLLVLVTPEFLGRPWLLTEWAAFWAARKEWACLLIDVKPADLFDPMRSHLAADGADAEALERLLRHLVDPASVTASISRAADILKLRLAEARQTQLQNAWRESNSYLRRALAGDVDHDLDAYRIKTYIDGGGLPELLQLVNSHAAAAPQVRLRQIGVALVQAGRYAEAESVARQMENRAERRRIAEALVLRIGTDKSEDPAEWQALSAYWQLLRPPQRRDIAALISKCGITPLAPWDADIVLDP